MKHKRRPGKLNSGFFLTILKKKRNKRTIRSRNGYELKKDKLRGKEMVVFAIQTLWKLPSKDLI